MTVSYQALKAKKLGESSRDLSADYVRELFTYDSVSGDLRWAKPRQGIRIGQRAGNTCPRGYKTVVIDYRKYQVHRIIWLWVHGAWPTHEIDHRDRNASNNALRNLRDATRSNNFANKAAHSNKIGGLKGAYYDKRRGTWFSSICKDYTKMYLGAFNTAEEAHAAYVAAAKRLFGEFARAA